ncbi:MAG: hypothetical protein LBL94_06435 [Prevotellaceae bacterium]|jgi:hypothetical protein|nr:hypothetical protein [Prevotellaceae bacterium]
MEVVVLLSKTYFQKHPKAGEETHFAQKVKSGISNETWQICRDCRVVEKFYGDCCGFLPMKISKKIHTCRSNYSYWAKKIVRLKEVGGVLSVRQWSDVPYRSPQETVVDIPDEVVSVQKLTFDKYDGVRIDGKHVELETLANNDGLSAEDFKSWFKGYGLSEPLAIIHFTKFRY